MMTLINEYMDKEYFDCPQCGSEDIVRDEFEYEARTRLVACKTCGFQWREHFAVIANIGLDGKGIPDPR